MIFIYIYFFYIPSSSKFPNYINSKNNKRITSISLFKSCSQIKVLTKQNQALPDDQDSISILTSIFIIIGQLNKECREREPIGFLM